MENSNYYKTIKETENYIKENNRRIKKFNKPKKDYDVPPKRSVLEEVGSSVSHGVGAILSIIGLVLLILASKTPAMLVSGTIFMVCMFIMYLNSCLYHAFAWGLKVKRIWRRFDYTSIYLLIAGTFAPIQLVLLERVHGTLGFNIGLAYFIVMWVLFVTGITFTCIFGPNRTRKINFPLYFVGGWSAVFMIPTWIQYDYHFALWIFIGGIIYTLGMIPFALLRNKGGAHFIWHIFVLLGSIAHFYAIYTFIFLK